MIKFWPELNQGLLEPELERSFAQLFESIRLVRNLRAEAGLKPSQKAPIRFITKNNSLLNLLKEAVLDIQSLTKANQVEIFHPKEISREKSEKSLAGVSGELEVILPVEGLIDLEALIIRLQKDLSKAEKEISTLSKRLDNGSFIDKAPKNVVLECREKLSKSESQAKLVRLRLSGLQ